ncbi:T9SS type A sorting domain-containing protein [Adhaeribacter swui]|uniref:T9SS type A sorting domain-containing protein n=1 Tax=Adhaeribacter swui TaxID=2086471 RepID=A0A7G7G4U8_9BACT|nr:YDG domain-containing protein [Adhaeribacter swui]QNF32182.1 T9SS type A sorting domain-containing protein [Adhaeribacter swui]
MRTTFTAYCQLLLHFWGSYKSFSIVSIFILITSFAKAQTVTFTPGGPFCVGGKVTVNIASAANGNKTYTVSVYNGKSANATVLEDLGTIGTSNSTHAGSGSFFLPSASAGSGRYIGVKLTNGSGATAFSSNSFTVNALPGAPTSGGDQSTTYGSANPTLSASAGSDQTLAWYDVPTGGEPIATGTTFTSPAITAGTYTYYAEARNSSGCASAVRTPVTLTINKRPLTITAIGLPKVYDGTAEAFVVLTANTIYGDVLLLYYNSSVYDDKNPGINKNITVSGITIGGNAAANYTLSKTTATTTANIDGDNDLDGIVDSYDWDDDNDGIPDLVETHNINAMGDDNGNGIPDYRDPSYKPATYNSITGVNDFFDQDRDGIINSLDLDSDGDGIPDAIEANNGRKPFYDYNEAAGRFTTGSVGNNGLTDSWETDFDSGIPRVDLPDTDKDGLPDFLDLDSDNDGLSDNLESQPESQPNGLARKLPKGTDGDKDGIDDQYDGTCGCSENGQPITPVITNTLNGIPDYLNLDSDSDQAPDFVEAYDLNYNTRSLDDLKALAANFAGNQATNSAAGKYYEILNLDPNHIPAWLQDDDQDGLPNYLDSGNIHYHDSNNNGWIDLFEVASYANELNPNPAFRQNITIVVLPVELINFKAQLTKNGTLVTWQTAAEHQNDYFLVERSTNGTTFETIGKVAGAGNSNQLLSYSFLDEHLVGGVNYYRLKQVSLSKQITTSKIVSVESPVISQVTSRAYPNPSSGNFNLEVTLPVAKELTLVVREVTGQIIRTQTFAALPGRNNIPLDLTQAPNGIYVVSILGDQLKLVERLVKN